MTKTRWIKYVTNGQTMILQAVVDKESIIDSYLDQYNQCPEMCKHMIELLEHTPGLCHVPYQKGIPYDDNLHSNLFKQQ